MTPKQEERIRNKIANIRKELAADKKRWGGFHHDGRGLRYIPPGLFIKLSDYKGGLRYLRWFNLTFSGDIAYPLFHLEWALILFKTGNLKEAEKKIVEVFFGSTHPFGKFLGKEGSDLEMAKFLENLYASISDPQFNDFREWVDDILNGEKFNAIRRELIEINKKIENEPVGIARQKLFERRQRLIYG
jgi:hypothetical protein